MTTDATPAATPGPTDPPATTFDLAPTPGAFAGILAPVDPARPTPSPAPGDPTDVPAGGASSATFHGTEEGKQDAAGKAAEKKGIVRAWLLAGADRWGKGGGTQNKRLDMRKAKAQAHQVKEARQVSVNRSVGSGSAIKSPSAAGSGGKSLGSKSNAGAGKSPKSSNGPAHKGSSGKPGGSVASGPPNRKVGGNSSAKSPKVNSGVSPKPSKGDGSKGGDAGGLGGGKDASRGPAGAKDGRAGKSGGAAGQNGKGPAPEKSTDDKNGKAPKAKEPAPGEKAAPAKKDGADGKGTPGKDAAKGSDPAKGATDGKPGTPAPTTAPGAATGKDGAVVPARPTKNPDKTPRAGDKKFTTQPSREAGYQDGTRLAKATAHVKAYGEGAKDGWTDTTEAAAREKDRLDKAHQEQKNARAKEQPVSTGSSADYHKPEGPKPIPVKAVTASHVLLGDGASVGSLTRGEVRSLKGFERRLSEKHTAMTKVADDTKLLEAHAASQAAKATKLLEQAKAVKGGEKLTARLTKHEDDAKSQAVKAADIHKRALRAAEACGAVLSNAKTRYGGIYKAVVDSDETAPAELAFYKG